MIKVYTKLEDLPKEIHDFGRFVYEIKPEDAKNNSLGKEFQEEWGTKEKYWALSNREGDQMYFAWDDWDYVWVPDNNKHDIDCAKELADRIGCCSYQRYDMEDGTTFFVSYHA